MSSSEQAPEPTMDEILASIRKIISDDEIGNQMQPGVAMAEPVAAEAVAPVGDGLADDLANAIADAQSADMQVAVEPSDDILDLTQVVTEQLVTEQLVTEQSLADGLLEPVAQEATVQEPNVPFATDMQPNVPFATDMQPNVPFATDMQPDGPFATEMQPFATEMQPDVAPAIPEVAVASEVNMAAEVPAVPPVASEVLAGIEASAAPEALEAGEGSSDITALLAKAGVQEMNDEAEALPWKAAASADAAAPAGDELNAAMARNNTAVPNPALVEETSISDVLSALDQPAGDAASQSQDASFDAGLVMSREPVPAPDEPSEAIASEAPEAATKAKAAAVVEGNTELDVRMPEPSAEKTPAPVQTKDALPEPEARVIDKPVEAAAALADALEEPALVKDALTDSEAEIEAEAIVEAEASGEVEEAVASPDADAVAPAGEVRTLEDSVKDLLRPMLREWLDDNMERIVQDEVASAKSKDSDS